MSSPVNAALLGSGLFATNSYVPALVNVEDLAISTVWSRSEQSATALRNKAVALGGLPHNSTEGPRIQHGEDGLAAVLADPTITAVVMVLPIGVQPALIRRAWAAGKHVLSEKPLGRDVSEARALIDEYEAKWAPQGLEWRVAENYAHEPLLLYAAGLLLQPAAGDVLYWRMHYETMLPDGGSYHGTTWRTVPDYQGGFLLDGGVHWAALLRTVLPARARPAAITAHKSLHRAHMLPHDTLIGLATPAAGAAVAPHGRATAVAGVRPSAELPTSAGTSAPHGSMIVSWATPDTPRDTRVPNELYVVAEHATLRAVNHGRSWSITLTPAAGSNVQRAHREGAVSGVEAELSGFAVAVAAAQAGTKDTAPNHGAPRAALWDLAFIQAALNSDGRPVDIAALINEKNQRV